MNGVYYSTEGFPYRVISSYGRYGKTLLLHAYKQGFMRSWEERFGLACVSFAYHGIGYIDANSISEFHMMRKSQAFRIWYGILSRLGKGAYKDVGIANEWRLFSNFQKFHEKWYHSGFVIDKDLLSGGKKLYSETMYLYAFSLKLYN